MPKSALAQAFKKAGIKSPQERLDEIADEAFASHPRTHEAARDYILTEVSKNLELTLAMFANWRRPAADMLLVAAATRSREMRAKIDSDASLFTNATRNQTKRSVGFSPTQTEKDAARRWVAGVISKLDTFKINNRPIGDCTPEEALAWRDSRARDNRFVDLLVNGLPPNLPIRQFIGAGEAEALYKQAQEEEGRNE